MSKIDESMMMIDWSKLTNSEKTIFTNHMMAMEISFREKEKCKAIVANRFFTSFFTMVVLLSLMFFEASEATMLIVSLSFQMLALAYSQLLEIILIKLHDKSKFSTNEILKNFEKKYPLEENNDLI